MKVDDREQVMELMRSSQFGKALVALKPLIDRNPSDAGLLYMAGQCCRFMNELPEAVRFLQKATDSAPGDSPMLLALGIVLQLQEKYEDAVAVLARAIEADPDFEFAYNSMAMTQKKMGQLEKALHNYDAGAKALTRKIVKSMKNSRASRIFQHPDDIHNTLWVKYALFGATYLSSVEEIGSMSIPTAEEALNEEMSEENAGLYWVDRESDSEKKHRHFLPNYFNAFRSVLLSTPSYGNLIGNRGTILKMLGRQAEVEQHFQEAMAFTSQFT